MKADLPQREPEVQRFWEERGIYRRVQEKARSAGRPKFILHDGPPYANVHIHIGHALNKILKDIVIKYRSLRGYYAPMVHGWDTHGLPIEQRVIKDLGLNRAEIPPVEFRRRCRDYALKYAAIQRDEIKRLGVWGNWEESYLTLAPEYEARQIEVFGEMARKGYIYRGLKSVYWCVVCETALAEAEIEYADRVSPSIYVRFPVREDGGRLGVGPARTSFLIWTTTPWTIPANLAVAVHPDFTYAVVEVEGEYLVVARDLLPEVARALGWRAPQVRNTLTGRQLEGVRCRHPLFERDSPVVLGEHVTLDQGTGCVHTAPGHGEEDFLLGEAYGLPVLCPVSADGRFTAEAGKYAGLTLREGDEAVMRDLAAGGYLAKREEITHSYPHCWRCKNPVIFRATEQWFASVEGFRQKALEAIHQVRWYPPWGEERIKNMVAERRDWCISRQRVWGVPIPIFYCEDCGRSVLDERTVAAVRDLFAREGSDAWFIRPAEEILPPGYRCSHCGGGTFRKETDIMD
ncbi:MAG: isoleucine--tRNA ligase, partial [Bacillota bacterium]|nr:isoleucine--tRNA ligase [Bacillota bacterium]